MATSIDIVNMALTHLGNKAAVVAIDPPDGSAEANWAARFYPQSVYSVLELGDWSFARKRAALASTATVGNVWRYAYEKPADCLHARRILTDRGTQFEDDSELFEIEGTTILTNKADAVLVYTQPLIDASKFPPSVTNTVSYMLASYLAGPILKGGEGTQASNDLRKAAEAYAARALASDGNQSQRDHSTQYVPGSTQARNGYYQNQ
jgi:hypothetical protein